MDHDNYAIMAGLDNGDIKIPEYAAVNALSDEVILFDAEEGGPDHWSAIHVTKKSEMTKEDLAKMIKDEHNVNVDIDNMMYTHGDIDDDYGWIPIPDEWLKK